MKRRPVVRTRVGMSLAELLVGLVIMGIIGVSAMKVFVTQTRFVDMQHKRRFARNVSRASINLLMSEMRMVENRAGVAAASDASGASSITVRVPVVMGIVCGKIGNTAVLSLMPVDSLVIANAGLSGYAYRNTDGTYTYNEGTITATAAGAATCAAAGITTVPGGRVVTVSPFPTAVAVTRPTFLYERIRFSFAASSMIPGRVGLWRTVEATAATEEVAAPFDSASSFRFYRNNNDTSDVAVPPLNEITGVELLLTGASEKPRFGKTAPEKAPLRTGVFFVNRID